MSNRSSFQKFHIPSYSHNAVIQLIAFSGVGFVAVHLVWITLIVYAVPEQRSFELTFEYVGLGTLERIGQRWWTILSYGWCHRSFWEWLSNMLWLYCFGNVVQNLVGYKQIIPLFSYSILVGGLAFAGIQFLPQALLPEGALLMGAQAGIVGLMTAALTLSPNYRMYLSEYFSVPLLALAGIFTFLMLLNADLKIASIVLLAGGALSGFIYVKLLQSGYQPGAWAYKVFHKMDTSMNPKESYRPVQSKTSREQDVDRILDKINENGYASLSSAEKEMLRETKR